MHGNARRDFENSRYLEFQIPYTYNMQSSSPARPPITTRTAMRHVSEPASPQRPEPIRLSITARLIHALHARLEAHPAIWFTYCKTIRDLMLKLEKYGYGGAINHFSVCTGTGMSSMVLHELLQYWRERFNVMMIGVEKVCAEKNPKKIGFAKAQHKPEFMLDDMSLLAAPKIPIPGTALLGQRPQYAPTPHCFLYDGGFPCQSLTGLSSSSSGNKGCIQDAFEVGKSSATGDGYRLFENNVHANWPEIVLGENLWKLFQTIKEKKFTDGDFILKRWREMGYYAMAEDSQHEDFGAPGVRRRAFLIGLLHLVGSEAEITHWFHSLFTTMQGEMDTTIEDFVDVDPVERRKNLTKLGIKSWADFPDRWRTPSDDGDVKWRVLHRSLCEIGHPINGGELPFPLEPSQVQELYIDYGGLLPREREAIIIIDAFFAPRSNFEFVDINTDLNWHLKSYLDEHWSWTEHAEEESPFKCKPFTDAGSTKFMMRRSVVT